MTWGSGKGLAADTAGRWLAVSLAALGVLAGAAAVVSFSAQFQMVRAARRLAVVSALEAGIPDAAALVFAALGIALALHGRRAVRARVLNLAAVGTSLGMNALAAGHGWRDLAIWVMPPAAYALASDTAIGVIRLRAIAPDPVTGPRRPAPGHPAVPPAGQAAISSNASKAARRPPATGAMGVRPGTKTARFLRLVTEHYGPLSDFPLSDVSPVASELAPAADLHPGAARSALRRHVLAARMTSAVFRPL
jgi:hypothetical protein